MMARFPVVHNCGLKAKMRNRKSSNPIKLALVFAVLEEVERFFLSTLNSVNASSQPAERVLAALSETMTGTLETHPDHSQIFSEWAVAVRSDNWPRYLKVYRKIIRLLAGVVERGQKEGVFRPDLNPVDEAAILHAASSALIQMKETGASNERIAQFHNSLLQSVMMPQKPKRSAAPLKTSR